MSRTVVNILGDLSGSAVIARSEGVWNASMVPAVPGLDASATRLDESPGWPEGLQKKG